MPTPTPTQDLTFQTFAGNDVAPIFTVVDADGTVVDISAATEITWTAREQPSSAASFTLLKSTGGITFPATGADGRFQANITAAQTLALAGYYVFWATVVLAAKTYTTSVGRMGVGPTPAWTYNPAQLLTVPLFQVRRLIGDVIQDDPQLWDNDILFALDQRGGNIYLAGADAAGYLAAQYARKVDTTSPGSISTASGTQAQKYADLSARLAGLGIGRGAGIMPFAGGISVTQKQSMEEDTDRVQPAFVIGMTDATLPIPQLGNETPIQHMPSSPS